MIDSLISAVPPGHYSYMSLTRVIRAGTFFSGMNMGMKMGRLMSEAFGPMEKDRKNLMNGRSYMYLMIIGVANEHQGKGHGGKLLRHFIDTCNQTGLPLYLETETEVNVRLYERFGFKTVNKITLPVVDHPMWEMLKEPDGI